MSARSFMVIGLVTAVATLAIRRLFAVIVVDGVSMEPTFTAGDRLLAVRIGLRWLVKDGTVVVGRFDPDEPEHLLVKRMRAWGPTRLALDLTEFSPALARTVAGRAAGTNSVFWEVPADHVFVRGDNPASADSVLWGPAPWSRIDGVIVRRLIV